MKFPAVFLSVLLLTSLFSFAHATQVIYQSPSQLVGSSQLVVNGSVSEVRSFWNADHTRILTEAIVDVEATHKGDAAASVRIVQLGGVVDNIRMTAHGAPDWQQGEEVLLFLEASLPGAFQITGFSQGKYKIERDASGAAYINAPDLKDLELVSAKGVRIQGETTSSARIEMNEFLNQIFNKK